jgi:hypothetical protein
MQIIWTKYAEERLQQWQQQLIDPAETNLRILRQTY